MSSNHYDVTPDRLLSQVFNATSIGEYAVSAVPNCVTVMEELHVTIGDKGGRFKADEYGVAKPALSNGILVQVVDGSDVIQDLTPEPIRRNMDWESYTGNLSITEWRGNYRTITCVWKFSNCIFLDNMQQFTVIIQEDLSFLNDHKFYVTGAVL